MMPVFFDLDGTLTDPSEGFVNCLRHAFDSIGLGLDPELELERYIGPPLHHTLRELCGSDELASLALAAYRERYSTRGLFENRIYDGIADCLDALSGAGMTHYVVTSKASVYSTRIVEHFAIDRHFKAVYGSNLDGSLADKGELIEHLLQSEGISPRDAVMIGDRKFDIIGARRHGIRSIGVLWGFGDERELRGAGAGSLCRDPRQLRQHIDGSGTG